MTKAEVAQIFAAARLDPQPFMERMLWIKDVHKQVVPLRLNESQLRLHACVQQQRRAGLPVRGVVLKARKVGISTFVEADMTTSLIATPHSVGNVVAMEKKTSQEVAEMSAFFLENLDPRLRPRGEAYLKGIDFEDIGCEDGPLPVRSKLQVDTATGKETGRGKTIHYLHLTEVGFYPNATATLTALLSAVPTVAGTTVILESTANGINGYGEEFHKRWHAAVRGLGGYFALFIPWFTLNENRLPAPEGFEETLTDDEREERALYSLDLDQLYWRRQTIDGHFTGDVERFRQEHPATSDESFILSGSPAFPKKKLIAYSRAAALMSFEEGILESDEPGQYEGSRFVPQPGGQLRIWQRPQPGDEFMIGVDTALGVEEGDASAAAVLNRKTNRMVAEWWGHIDPRLYGHLLAMLGYYFNTATLAVEINNMGLTTQTELLEHLFYPKLFRWRRHSNLKNRFTDQVGWQTSRWTRPLLIDDMGYGIRTELLGLVSVPMISELITFDATGSKVAADDLAIAACISWHCHLVTPLEDGTMPRTLIAPAKPSGPPEPADRMSREAWREVDRLQKHVAGGGPSVAELSDVTGEDGEESGPHAWDGTEDPMPEVPT